MNEREIIGLYKNAGAKDEDSIYYQMNLLIKKAKLHIYLGIGVIIVFFIIMLPAMEIILFFSELMGILTGVTFIGGGIWLLIKGKNQMINAKSAAKKYCIELGISPSGTLKD